MVKQFILAGFFAVSSSVAQAATVSGTVCEGGVSPAGESGCGDIGITLGDFDANPGDPVLEVVGDTHLWGGVAQASWSLYQDSWTMDFGTDVFLGDFRWQPVSEVFGGLLSVGGTEYELSSLATPGGDAFSIGNLTGDVTFVLDAAGGPHPGFGPNQVATWDLSLTNMSRVPLPLSLGLLSSAIIGLGGLRLVRKPN